MTEQKKNSQVKEIIQIDSELLENISHLIQTHAEKSILNIFAGLHSADIGEIINHLRFEDAVYLFNLLKTETAGEVITEIDDNLREKILNEIDKQKLTDIVDELDYSDKFLGHRQKCQTIHNPAKSGGYTRIFMLRRGHFHLLKSGTESFGK